jgi:hypothetical protein
MVMAMGTMHMAVLNLFLNGRTHIHHIQLKAQGLTRPWMVAI